MTPHWQVEVATTGKSDQSVATSPTQPVITLTLRTNADGEPTRPLVVDGEHRRPLQSDVDAHLAPARARPGGPDGVGDARCGGRSSVGRADALCRPVGLGYRATACAEEGCEGCATCE